MLVIPSQNLTHPNNLTDAVGSSLVFPVMEHDEKSSRNEIRNSFVESYYCKYYYHLL